MKRSSKFVHNAGVEPAMVSAGRLRRTETLP